MTLPIGATTLPFRNIPMYKAIEKIHDYGFKIIELEGDYLIHCMNEKQKIKNVKNKLDVEYTIHAPIIDLCLASPIDSMRRHSINLLKQFITLTSYFNSQIIVVHLTAFSSDPFSMFKTMIKGNMVTDEMLKASIEIMTNIVNFSQLSEVFDKPLIRQIFIEKAKESIIECNDFAVDHDVILCLENLSTTDVLFTKPSDFEVIVKDIKSKNLGITYDTSDAYLSNSLLDWFKLKKFIKHVHLCETDGKVDSKLTLGKGKVNFNQVLKKLKQINYRGNYILENLTIQDCIESRNYIRRIFKLLASLNKKSSIP